MKKLSGKDKRECGMREWSEKVERKNLKEKDEEEIWYYYYYYFYFIIIFIFYALAFENKFLKALAKQYILIFKSNFQ